MLGVLLRWSRAAAVVFVCASAVAVVRAQSATLIADTHVSSTQPDVNSGALSNLNVGGGYTALLQFDLGMLPANLTPNAIARATLRVYCNRADTPGEVNLAPINAPWGEYSVTYATMPAVGVSAQNATVSAADSFVTFDITALVQGWVATPSSNNGIALTAATAVVQFDSKENDVTAHEPELEITLASGSGVAGPAGPTGETGAIGPQGPAGAQGLQGLAGTPGAAGATGAAGPQGAAGLQGATGEQGPQGVSGATGASGPQGAPGSAGQVGEKGDQGAQGIAGQAGAQGPAGATGATGLQGPAGIQGQAGPVGMTWRGAYASTTNYALADAVLWQGSAWVSLVGNNFGNTPSDSPASWQIFAAAGSSGAVGATGATGATGVQGPQGVQGLSGADGLAGAVGATGKPGLVYRGTYESATNYALGDVVLWQGASWASLNGSNSGNTPSDSPVWWGVLTSQGPQGEAGPVGTTGLQGEPGPQGMLGPVGSVGPTGPAGLQGPAGTQGLQGDKGDRGDTGAQGLQGIAGQAGAQGTQGPQGSTGLQGSAGPTGAAGTAGSQGPQGPAGAVGMNFRNAWNSSTQYALNDSVTWNGSTYLAQDSSKNIQPDSDTSKWSVIAQAGGAGPTGAAGQAPTVTVGTVTTLSAGSSATVAATSTDTGIALNFGIPQGAQGAAGSAGGSNASATGNSFAATYHSVSYTTGYYFALNNQNASANEAATVETWIPQSCTASELDVYSLQSGTITVTLRDDSLTSPDTSLTCTINPASTKTCTSTGSVAISAGDFLDLHITGSSSTAAGVWTKVVCN